MRDREDEARRRDALAWAVAVPEDEGTSDEWDAVFDRHCLLATLDRERAARLVPDETARLREALEEAEKTIEWLRESIRILQENWPKTIPAPMDSAR